MNTMNNIFGEVIYSYTRKQAIEDGQLISVDEVAKEVGFLIPVAVTRAVWADCVECGEADSRRQTYQDETGRLWDVLWMAMNTARRGAGAQRHVFQLYRVPRGGHGVRPRSVKLVAHIGPGDDGDPVITILLPGED